MQKTLLPAILISSVAGAAASILIAPLVWGPPAEPPAGPPPLRLEAPEVDAAAAKSPSPQAALLPAEWLDRLDALEDRLSRLEAQPSAPGAARTPLAALDAQPSPPIVAPAVIENLVQEAITADYERREQDREVRREQAQQEWIDQRADRLAEELGLGSSDRNRLADVLLGEQDRRRELMDEMRETGPTGDVRDRFQEIRSWKEAELTAQLGAEVATQVLERDRDRGPGGGGGGPGGPFGGGRGRGSGPQ